MNTNISPATNDDIPAIRELQDEAVQWLADIGESQWQSTHASTDTTSDRSLNAAIKRGEVFLLREDTGAIAATITIDDYADPEFWTPEDHPEQALYIHRMIVKRDRAGSDLGAQLVDFAAQRAAALGKKCLRLDAWKTNSRLHDYYINRGFRHVRTVDLDHRGSGTLFEKQAEPSRL